MKDVEVTNKVNGHFNISISIDYDLSVFLEIYTTYLEQRKLARKGYPHLSFGCKWMPHHKRTSRECF